jgi:hypothetical protein
MFSLRFREERIPYWADRNARDGSEIFLDIIGPGAKARGYLSQSEFQAMCAWKSPRSKPRCASNSEALVQELTSTALAARNEELCIGALLLLDGVSWPTASVILHFCATTPYPILDFRALWTLKTWQPSAYSFPFWLRYVQCCRALAQRNDVSMRTLDRALWQYSKERQPT